jgi:hypothetical protein
MSRAIGAVRVLLMIIAPGIRSAPLPYRRVVKKD